MILNFLGTGTSQGVPVIGCHCPVCRSDDPRDHRLRSSVLLTTDDQKNLLIDCGPDFRLQMLRAAADDLEAALITHEHNDHIIGLDDMRPLIFRKGKNIDIYAKERVANEIRERFPYAFATVRYPGAPSFDLHHIDGPLEIAGVKIQPLEVMHGNLPILGFRIRNLAYVTDASYISPQENEKMQNLEYLILNCIRKDDLHPSHYILPQAIELFEELRPRKMLLTHISHHMGLFQETSAELPEGIELAYDGLQLDF